MNLTIRQFDGKIASKNRVIKDMTNEITIYLAGKIQKAHEDPNETYWTNEDQKTLREALAPKQVHFLNPAFRNDDLSDQKSVFGRDMVQVFSSDIIFVDARERRGLGVGAEMMWAKMNHKPVVTLAPVGSHYHKKRTTLLGVSVDLWVHPFVEGLSDVIVESLAEGATWLKTTLQTVNIKGPESIQEAMQYYLQTQYPKDDPMVALTSKSETVESRLRSIDASLSSNK